MIMAGKEVFCSVCGLSSTLDGHFWKEKKLCNRHNMQLEKHGKLLDKDIVIPKKRHRWTPEEETRLEELYKQGVSFEKISKQMNLSVAAIAARSRHLNLGNKYMRSNNPNFKATYQDYDWCYERYVVKGMTHQEMADECGASLRVIQKWCSEVHKLNCWTFKNNKTLTDKQYQIILFGTLGDGHIDKRETQPLYIECHSIAEKDYVFWKYEELKDLCNSEPKYYEGGYKDFGSGTKYWCKPHYRFETRIINQLKDIRDMPRINKIWQLNEFGLSLHCLDDGCRGKSAWELCLAEYTQQEIDLYIKLCKKRFGLYAKQQTDKRYIRFDSDSSRIIDQIILNNIPNSLDIIKKKILENDKISKKVRYIYVVMQNGEQIGLSTYCRSHGIPYEKTRKYVIEHNIFRIQEADLLNRLKAGGLMNAV